jgi:thiol-disulfide isomerase/thioredoxin
MEYFTRLSFYLGIMILWACQASEPNLIIINGTVANAQGETLFLRVGTHLPQFESVELELDNEQSFTYSFSHNSPCMLQLVYEDVHYPIFLEPGQALMIHADGDRFSESLSFEGTGSAENTFFRYYGNNMASKTVGGLFFLLVKDLEPSSVPDHLLQLMQKRRAAVDSLIAEAAFSEAFLHFIESEIRYETFSMLMEYPRIYTNVRKPNKSSWLPVGYYDFLEHEDLFDDRSLLSDQYRRFVDLYLKYQYQLLDALGHTWSGSVNRRMFELAEQLLPERTSMHQQSIYLHRIFSRGDLTEAQDLYMHYMDRQPPVAYAEPVRWAYEQANSLIPGFMAPDFTLSSWDGQDVSLSDFRDRVVFLDFWASWCAPCISQVPYAKKLKERVSDEIGSQNLVFLYVSVDTDEEAWRQGVTQHGIEGVHLWADGWAWHLSCTVSRACQPIISLGGMERFLTTGRQGQAILVSRKS